MRNKEIEQPALLNIERNPLVLAISGILSAIFSYFCFDLLKNVNPWGFIVMIPAAILCFQTIWLLLNPFALVFKDKIEIRQTLFQYKEHYYIDIKKVIRNSKGRLYITYKDDEVEPLKLAGIRKSHVQLLKNEFDRYTAPAPVA